MCILKHYCAKIINKIKFHRYKSLACSPTYKAALDNTWRKLVLLQQLGFMLWAQALEFMDRPTGHIATLYATRTAVQV